MKCFEVTINGKRICTAGIGESGVLTGILALVVNSETQHKTPSESLDLRVGGLANREDGVSEQVEWLRRDLKVGDEIVIRIVEAVECDEPTSKQVTHSECSFCGKQGAEAKKLVAGPSDYICDECVRECLNALATSEPAGRITIIINKSAKEVCSFCGRKPIDVDGMVGVPRARICNLCVLLCEDVLAGRV